MSIFLFWWFIAAQFIGTMRQDRTSKYVIQVEAEWSLAWWIFITSQPDIDMNDEMFMDSLSGNINLSIDIVKANLNLPWNWDLITKVLPLECMDINPDKNFIWDWNYSISRNPYLTMDFINANPDKPWNWEYISANPAITLTDIKNNPQKPWIWYYISSNPSITIKDIQNNPNFLWHWGMVAQNPNITYDFVKRTPELHKWIDRVIYRVKFTPDEIAHLIDKNVSNCASLSYNPSLTMEIINSKDCACWNWEAISRNPNISTSDVMLNINKPWYWEPLISSIELTREFIDANEDKEWFSEDLSDNPHLTIEFIKQNSDLPWDFAEVLAANPLVKEKTKFTDQKYREYMAAYRIQQWWHRIRLDPRHPVGIRRLEREYDQLFPSM